MRNTDGYPYLVIDADNAHRFAAVPGGYMGWQKPGERYAFSAPRPFGPTIPRSQWAGLIKAGQGTFLSDLLKQQGIQAKNQKNLISAGLMARRVRWKCPAWPKAWPFATCRRKAWPGPSRAANQGGYASQAYNQLERGGACESTYLDAPNSLNSRQWKAGWQDNAQLHRAVAWYEIGTSYDEVITCLLNRIPVGCRAGLVGHLVCFLDPVISARRIDRRLVPELLGRRLAGARRQRTGDARRTARHARRRSGRRAFDFFRNLTTTHRETNK